MKNGVRLDRGDCCAHSLSVLDIYLMKLYIVDDFAQTPRLMRWAQDQVNMMSVAQETADQIGSDKSAAACNQCPHIEVKLDEVLVVEGLQIRPRSAPDAFGLRLSQLPGSGQVYLRCRCADCAPGIDLIKFLPVPGHFSKTFTRLQA